MGIDEEWKAGKEGKTIGDGWMKLRVEADRLAVENGESIAFWGWRSGFCAG